MEYYLRVVPTGQGKLGVDSNLEIKLGCTEWVYDA